MHEELVKHIVEICRTRLGQGDNPIPLPPSRENLEDAVIALADEIDSLKSKQP